GQEISARRRARRRRGASIGSVVFASPPVTSTEQQKQTGQNWERPARHHLHHLWEISPRADETHEQPQRFTPRCLLCLQGHSLPGTARVDCADCALSTPILKTTGLLLNKPADATREQAVEIRYGQVGLLQVRLHTTNPGAILDELT